MLDADKMKAEQKALDTLEDIRCQKNVSLAELGRQAFPDKAASHMVMQALRKDRGDGKKQRLTLGDFLAICTALGEDSIEVLKLAWGRKQKK
ncbi:hypothetical protein LJC59_07520 [Desulfovibrio sp. OttesenSCG-928-A18]|nr:hypothetical protein [Desulfovibrio sp. OttesenSCG-928-A18]